jgi:hypothetical protein
MEEEENQSWKCFCVITSIRRRVKIFAGFESDHAKLTVAGYFYRHFHELPSTH